jgi:hypothetical protein
MFSSVNSRTFSSVPVLNTQLEFEFATRSAAASLSPVLPLWLSTSLPTVGMYRGVIAGGSRCSRAWAAVINICATAAQFGK